MEVNNKGKENINYNCSKSGEVQQKQKLLL